MKDLHGRAIRDFYQNKLTEPLLLHTSYGETDEMPVEVFFREEIDLSVIEHLALIECKGKVLDIGAGAGAISLILESRGFDVYALENSPGCVEVMKQSGVSRIINQDYQHHKGTYDTLLLLMNGLGIAGKLSGVTKTLQKCKTLIKSNGQILIDSSDISYLYEDGNILKPQGYYGDLQYRYEYGGNRGDWFDWVYVDSATLHEEVKKVGMNMEVLTTDENDQYLALITL